MQKPLTQALQKMQHQLDELEHDLAEFQERYELSSAEFYTQFQAGEMGDDVDLIEWASLYQMTERLRERITLLAIS